MIARDEQQLTAEWAQSRCIECITIFIHIESMHDQLVYHVLEQPLMLKLCQGVEQSR